MKLDLFHHYWKYFILSGVLFIVGAYAVLQGGLRLSIDFTGGSLLEIIPIESEVDLDTQKISDIASESYEVSSVQQSGQQGVLLRLKEISNEQKDSLVQQISQQVGQVQEQRFERVGPTLGRELLLKTIFAIILVSMVITWFIMHQFSELKYGISAVLAMFHDSIVLFASFAILGLFFAVEIDVLFVTALLTTLSFSVHDTIVLYDRIRELRKKHSRGELKEVANVATLETFSRSVNNSMTIIFMLLALVLLGGDTLRWFAVALLIGAITGTYSSPFIAVPLLLTWDDVAKKLRERKKKK